LIALFVALGGTSYAAIATLPANSVGTTQLKNGAVTRAKINKTTISGLTGPAAYARVLDAGTVDTTQAKGITSANVSHPGTGIYCFSGLTVTPHNVVDSPQHTDVTLSAFVNHGAVYASCPGTSQISVVEETGGGVPQDGPFMIAIN
jgi:hypothetical protein